MSNPVLPNTESLGSCQGPLIVKSAIELAFASLRGPNSWMLDYIFRGVSYDLATNGLYGDAWVAQAKKWFFSTDIPVYWSISMEAAPPCISLALLNSSQANETLGDIHYTPTELFTPPPVPLTLPFTPASYTVATGTFVVPASIGTALNIYPLTMAVQTKTGMQYPIMEVFDSLTFEIADGVNDDFTNCTIVQPGQSGVLHLESTRMKDTMAIMLHIVSDPIQLIYLTAIMEVILMAFKESLFEARGLAISSFSMSDFGKDFTNMEARFTRSFTLEYTREIRYPKVRSGMIAGVSPTIYVEDGGEPFETDLTQLMVIPDGVTDGDTEP